MPTNLYLIRHAEYINSEDNGILGGVLSPNGIKQAENLRDRLEMTKELAADILISSTMLRAKQTAEIIAPAIDLPIIFDDEVQEWRNSEGHTLNGGDFSAQLMASPFDQRPFFYPTDDGESWAKFAFRAGLALNRISREYDGKNIVIVCHGGIIEASFLLAYGLSPLAPSPIMMMVDPAYTSITHWIKLSDTFYRWRLARYNDTYHLFD